MCSRTLSVILVLVAFLPGDSLIWNRPLLAQGSKLGLSPADQKKYDELVQSGNRHLMLGYIFAAVAILLAVGAIPLSIYLDRRKKARQKAAQLVDQKRANMAAKLGRRESE